MATNDRAALLCLLALMLLAPALLGALQQVPQRQTAPTVFAGVAYVAPTATPLPWKCSPTPRPPEPTATVFVLPAWVWARPTATPGAVHVFVALTPIPEWEGVAWLRSVGQ